MASCRPAAFGQDLTRLLALLLLLSPAATARADTEAPGEPLRRWGFGWDPVISGNGLTVRYRVSPVWDVAVAAGPNDYRRDEVDLSWDDDSIAYDDGVPRTDSDRREQGWVRLSGGRRVWRDGRLGVSGVAALTYRWSVEEWRLREIGSPSGSGPDYRNRRESHDIDTWTLALGIRPSVAVTPRLQVEFEAGLEFERQHTDYEYEAWWDSHEGTETRTEDVEYRTFGTYGGFEFYNLKFIFWF